MLELELKKVIILDNFVKLAADWTWEIHIHESAAKCEHGSRFDFEYSNALALPLTKARC